MPLTGSQRHDLGQQLTVMQHSIDSLEQHLIIRMHQELVVQTRWMTGVVVGAVVSTTAAVLAWG